MRYEPGLNQQAALQDRLERPVTLDELRADDIAFAQNIVSGRSRPFTMKAGPWSLWALNDSPRAHKIALRCVGGQRSRRSAMISRIWLRACGPTLPSGSASRPTAMARMC